MEGFVSDREAIGKLVWSLWKFVNENHGVITRSDPVGDIRMTVDFSNVIPPTDLKIYLKRLQSGFRTRFAATESVSLFVGVSCKFPLCDSRIGDNVTKRGWSLGLGSEW